MEILCVNSVILAWMKTQMSLSQVSVLLRGLEMQASVSVDWMQWTGGKAGMRNFPGTRLGGFSFNAIAHGRVLLIRA